MDVLVGLSLMLDVISYSISLQYLHRLYDAEGKKTAEVSRVTDSGYQ